MDEQTDLDAMARTVIDTNAYFVIGTVDPDGTPRVSPVYFGVDRYTDFYWVSSPEAHHSRNVAARPPMGAVVYDSTAPVGAGRAVYLTGTARQVTDDELPERCEVAFRDLGGARAFAPDELKGAANLRLYVLHADGCEVHVPGRHPTLGTGIDRRVPVSPQLPAAGEPGA